MRSSIAGVGLLSLVLTSPSRGLETGQRRPDLASRRPGFETAGAQEPQIPGKGIYDLVRHLLRGGPEGVSKRIRLADRDPRGGRATLYFTAGPAGEIYAVFELARDTKLLVHTVRITDAAERSTRPQVIKMEPVGDAERGELVVTRLSPEATSWIGEAESLTIELQGWDRNLHCEVSKKKDLGRIRAFFGSVLETRSP